MILNWERTTPLGSLRFLLFSPQGLRLNRTLVCLSLSNNQIGDVGAAQLAGVFIYLTFEALAGHIIHGTAWLLHLFHQILGAFALSHEEAEERIKRLERKSVSQLFHLWVVPVPPAPPPQLLRASGTRLRGMLAFLKAEARRVLVLLLSSNRSSCHLL